MAELKDKRLFLLDMDGTIYLDEQLFDGTLDFLAHVQRIGGRSMYLTNNSSKSVNDYIKKLKKLKLQKLMKMQSFIWTRHHSMQKAAVRRQIMVLCIPKILM